MWEYMVTYLYHDEFQRELNKWGREGWELVSVVKDGTYNCFLKRPRVKQCMVEESGDYPK